MQYGINYNVYNQHKQRILIILSETLNKLAKNTVKGYSIIYFKCIICFSYLYTGIPNKMKPLINNEEKKPQYYYFTAYEEIL